LFKGKRNKNATLLDFNIIMKWIILDSEQELEKIKELSNTQAVLIFKHSTRCSISSTALNRLERSWKDEEMKDIKPYHLDLITYRSISNKIADTFNVPHESPQVLLIKNGKCIYNASHLSISYKEINQYTF
jgi:bacillithiol system protein YtxJ